MAARRFSPCEMWMRTVQVAGLLPGTRTNRQHEFPNNLSHLTIVVDDRATRGGADCHAFSRYADGSG